MAKARVNRLPGTKPVRKITPRCAYTQQPQHGFQHLACVARRATHVMRSRHQRLDQLPMRIRQLEPIYSSDHADLLGACAAVLL